MRAPVIGNYAADALYRRKLCQTLRPHFRKRGEHRGIQLFAVNAREVDELIQNLFALSGWVVIRKNVFVNVAGSREGIDEAVARSRMFVVIIQNIRHDVGRRGSHLPADRHGAVPRVIE